MPNLLKQADLSLGYCYGQLHSVDQEINAYQRVVKIDPFSAPARQGLTDALLTSGRVDEAVQQYSTLLMKRKSCRPAHDTLRQPFNQAEHATQRRRAKVGPGGESA